MEEAVKLDGKCLEYSGYEPQGDFFTNRPVHEQRADGTWHDVRDNPKLILGAVSQDGTCLRFCSRAISSFDNTDHQVQVVRAAVVQAGERALQILASLYCHHIPVTIILWCAVQRLHILEFHCVATRLPVVHLLSQSAVICIDSALCSHFCSASHSPC